MLRITIVLPTPLGPSRTALTPSWMKPSGRRSSTASLSILFDQDQLKSAMALKGADVRLPEGSEGEDERTA
jgi:hypothetical protein